MSLLQPGELADMQAEAMAGMDQECVIWSNSGASYNGAGGRSAATGAFQPVAGGPFPCRVWRQRDFALVNQSSGATQANMRFKVSLPVGTPVDSKMRLEIVGGLTLEVRGVDGLHADAIQIVCDCELVN